MKYKIQITWEHDGSSYGKEATVETAEPIDAKQINRLIESTVKAIQIYNYVKPDNQHK